MKVWILSLLVLVSFLSAAQDASPPTDQPTTASIALGFTNLVRVTPTPVAVDSVIAERCIQLRPEVIERMRRAADEEIRNSVTIFMSTNAVGAFTNRTRYPVGSAIVKQKWLTSHTNAVAKSSLVSSNGIGGMIKRAAGYDPEHADWEYFYADNSGKLVSGKIATCIDCHETAKHRDYVFGTWKKASAP